MAERTLPLPRFQRACPQCRRGRLGPVHTVESLNLLCALCGACWQPRPHLLCRVDPATCPGCPFEDLCSSRGPDDADTASLVG